MASYIKNPFTQSASTSVDVRQRV